MIHLRRVTRRRFGLAAAASLILMTLVLYLLAPGTDDSSFPTEQFELRWNASPYCGESLSKRIHLMYSGQQVPKAYEAHIRSWSGRFPGFELHFWTDSGIEKFLSSQYGKQMIRFLRSKLAHGVERSDVSRLLIVNHFGGLYADLDVMALQSAEPLMKNHSLIFTEEPMPHAVFLYDRSSLISNAIVYSTPCHEFWRYYFKYYPAYLDSNYGGTWTKWRRSKQRYLAVYATGPVALDKIARQFIEQRRPRASSVFVALPVHFQPRIDADAPVFGASLIRNCAPLLRQVFLTQLQRTYCRPFLDNPDSMLLKNNGSVTYTRHDYLHLSYDKAKTDMVAIIDLLPKAVLHL